MTERNIAAEVLEGLREVREHRAGERTLKSVRVEPRPLPTLTPEIIRSIRDRLGVSRAVFAHMIRVPIRTVPARRTQPPRPRPASSSSAWPFAVFASGWCAAAFAASCFPLCRFVATRRARWSQSR